MNKEYFKNDLKNGLPKCSKNYESFENAFVTVFVVVNPIFLPNMPMEKTILIEKENIILNSNDVVENEKLTIKNDEIAKIFNKHFSETVDKLNTFE